MARDFATSAGARGITLLVRQAMDDDRVIACRVLREPADTYLTCLHRLHRHRHRHRHRLHRHRLHRLHRLHRHLHFHLHHRHFRLHYCHLLDRRRHFHRRYFPRCRRHRPGRCWRHCFLRCWRSRPCHLRCSIGPIFHARQRRPRKPSASLWRTHFSSQRYRSSRH